jgi:hypothetical protein
MTSFLLADWDAIWPRLVGFGALAVIIVVVVGAVKYNPARRLRSILDEELSADDVEHEPLVGIVFHTCYGVLHFSVHNTHNLRLSAPAAERLLRRLHRFNCTWGWLTPGGPFVPFVSRSEYKAQLRSIEEQKQFAL